MVLLEFREALAAEINSVSAQIAVDEQQLSTEEDRAQSGRLRIRLLLCRRHRERLEEIKKQLPLPIDVEIEDVLGRFDRWFVAAAEVEECDAAMRRLEPLVSRAQNLVVPAENSKLASEAELADFIRKPVDPLASGAEVSQSRARAGELRKKFDSAHQKMLRAVQERDARQNELFGARQRRDAASFKARMLLSPEIVASLEEAHAGAAT